MRISLLLLLLALVFVSVLGVNSDVAKKALKKNHNHAEVQRSLEEADFLA